MSEINPIYGDITLGLELICDNGKVVKIKPHSQRVGFRFWQGNGVVMETLVYEEPQDGEYENDRIHLLVHPEGEPMRGYLLTVFETRQMVEILEEAIKKSMELGIPEE